MKTRKWIGLLAVAYLPVLLVSAFTVIRAHGSAGGHASPTAAAESAIPSKFYVNMFTATKVNGEQLEPGEYSVRWERDANGVVVTFARADVVQAVSQAELVSRDWPSRYSVVLLKRDLAGQNVIAELDFEGAFSALVLKRAAASSESGETHAVATQVASSRASSVEGR
jgi:hypothetical protein